MTSVSALDCDFFRLEKSGRNKGKNLEKLEEMDLSLIFSELSKLSNSENYFFSGKKKDEESLILFDPAANKWKASRFIGTAQIRFYDGNKYQTCKVEIKPRFGEDYLAYMLEKSFDIKFQFTKSQDDGKQKKQDATIIDKIIGLMWLIKLNHANRYGLPTTRQLQTHQGYQIKGRIDTRHTAIAYHTRREAVSHYQEKIIDPVVAAILGQAYMLLKQNKQFSDTWLQDASLDAITHLKKTGIRQKWINPADYHNIRYRSLYTSYKEVVDMSWDIIRNRQIQQHIGEREGYGFFLDMAQIWELYLKSLLRRSLKDWHVVEDNPVIYTGQFYKRNMIPDIVLRRGNQYIVFDAKWKQMKGVYYDVDREDIYQIHTYINYYQQKGEVVMGGLLYPLECEFSEDTFHSNNLFNISSTANIRFIIDGVDLKGKEDKDKKTVEISNLDKNNLENILGNNEKAFINRLKKYLPK